MKIEIDNGAHGDRARGLWLRPLSGPEEEDALHAAAKADGHEILCPQYIVTRMRGEKVDIVGGIGCWPVYQAWMHTKHVKARDSLSLVAALEDRVRQRHERFMCLPCTPISPYRPVMEKLGFKLGYEAGLYFKPL